MLLICTFKCVNVVLLYFTPPARFCKREFACLNELLLCLKATALHLGSGCGLQSGRQVAWRPGSFGMVSSCLVAALCKRLPCLKVIALHVGSGCGLKLGRQAAWRPGTSGWCRQDCWRHCASRRCSVIARFRLGLRDAAERPAAGLDIVLNMQTVGDHGRGGRTPRWIGCRSDSFNSSYLHRHDVITLCILEDVGRG